VEPRAVISNLEKLLVQGKDSALLRFSLGNEYFKLREIWVAIFHLKRALELDPNYSAAWKLLGKTLVDTDDAAGAIAAYRQGIAAATTRGDKQAEKEMRVFLKRLQKDQ